MPFYYAILRALELLEGGWYTVAGSDLHNRVMQAKARGDETEKESAGAAGRGEAIQGLNQA